MRLLTGLLAFAPALALAQATDTQAERGRHLFMRNGCFACHGTVGQGGERSGAPKLAPDTYPFDAFRALVRTPREAMPRFDAQFVSDDDLRAIHRYLSTLPQGPAAKDIALLR
jgi:ubiquinol-cytochrome c reductase cytochrome c subunit